MCKKNYSCAEEITQKIRREKEKQYSWAQKLVLLDKNTATLSCLIAFSNIKGQNHKIDTSIDIAPISLNGPNEKIVQFIARKINIRATPILAVGATISPIIGTTLVVRTTGYAFLILEEFEHSYLVALPGAKKILQFAPKNSDVDENIRCAFTLQHSPRAYSRRLSLGGAKFYFLGCKINPISNYDQARLKKIHEELTKLDHQRSDPEELTDMTIDSLLKSHSSISPKEKKFHGVFRNCNLRRTHDFVEWREIENLLFKLILESTKTILAEPELVFEKIPLILTDFLTIHPFIDGNRRMSMVFLDRLLAQINFKINWDKISKCEFYYYVRCASRGHPQGLKLLLIQNRQRIKQIEN